MQQLITQHFNRLKISGQLWFSATNILGLYFIFFIWFLVVSFYWNLFSFCHIFPLFLMSRCVKINIQIRLIHKITATITLKHTFIHLTIVNFSHFISIKYENFAIYFWIHLKCCHLLLFYKYNEKWDNSHNWKWVSIAKHHWKIATREIKMPIEIKQKYSW